MWPQFFLDDVLTKFRGRSRRRADSRPPPSHDRRRWCTGCRSSFGHTHSNRCPRASCHWSSRPLLGDYVREGFRSVLRQSALNRLVGPMHAGGSTTSDIAQLWDEDGINLSSRSELRWKGVAQPSSRVTPEARFVVEPPRAIAASSDLGGVGGSQEPSL